MKSPRDHHWDVLEKYRASCAFSLGAGDGNRTRTISLGIGAFQGFHVP
jgi:hypothetical protein